ncbi:hypothetical protein Taro_019955 [Colocasia esculenta]|uniref:Uncharacterized protein n=1 Tax=Colocasia esculenta TaxID=4460 RepID=A0A843UXK2_COLES|nr:hypothetical protein [Colocasia esculenta]
MPSSQRQNYLMTSEAIFVILNNVRGVLPSCRLTGHQSPCRRRAPTFLRCVRLVLAAVKGVCFVSCTREISALSLSLSLTSQLLLGLVEGGEREAGRGLRSGLSLRSWSPVSSSINPEKRGKTRTVPDIAAARYAAITEGSRSAARSRLERGRPRHRVPFPVRARPVGLRITPEPPVAT